MAYEIIKGSNRGVLRGFPRRRLIIKCRKVAPQRPLASIQASVVTLFSDYQTTYNPISMAAKNNTASNLFRNR